MSITMTTARVYKGTTYEKRPMDKAQLINLIKVWNTVETMPEVEEAMQRPATALYPYVRELRKQGVDMKRKAFASGHIISRLVREVVEGK